MNLEFLDNILSFAVQKAASDIHIVAGTAPTIRVHGHLKKIDSKILTDEDLKSLINNLLSDEQYKVFAKQKELDFAYSIPGKARFRTNVYNQSRGISIAFRVIPDTIRSLKELNVPDGVYDLACQQEGLVLVTGPTGSGKTTTLAGMIDYIDSNFHMHILTVEDPIEYVYRGKKCLINQRELGPHTHSFANALRAALREDPDVILIGEMRDLETISLALTAAETGHLVFGTLHTNSASETINRIVDVFSADQQDQIRAQFSNSILGVISQRLLPTLDGMGRVAAVEIMIATSAIKNMIREGKTHQIPSMIQTGGKYNMQSMDQSLMQHVNNRKISVDQALKFANDVSFIKKAG